MKSLLERIKDKKKNIPNLDDLLENTSYEKEQESRIKRTSNTNVLLPNECIFCKKIAKYRNKKLEKLSLCCESRAVDTIETAAKRKEDFRIISLLSKDLIAQEGKYHRTCYNDYTRINYKNEQVEPTSRYKLIELESFKEVIKAGHRLITEEVTIIKFQILTDIMEETFIAKRETINKSTKKNLQRNVEKTFKEALKFLNHEGSLYVYPNTLTFDILLKMFIDKEDDDEKNGIIKNI